MAPLSAQTPTARTATIEDFLAIPPSKRFHEMLDGQIVQKTMPGARHGSAQLCLGGMLIPAFGPGAQGDQPGGWWLMAEVEVELSGRQVVRPDLVGWRMETMPELPEGFPVKVRPDWICEVVSPSDPTRDTVVKVNAYARNGVPHYWLVDLQQKTLTTLKLQGEQYAVDVEADATQTVRAAPFELVEIAVGLLFGQRLR